FGDRWAPEPSGLLRSKQLQQRLVSVPFGDRWAPERPFTPTSVGGAGFSPLRGAVGSGTTWEPTPATPWPASFSPLRGSVGCGTLIFWTSLSPRSSCFSPPRGSVGSGTA